MNSGIYSSLFSILITDGGAIYSEDSIYLNSNIFKSNFANYGSGGAVYGFGDIFDLLVFLIIYFKIFKFSL